MVPVKWVTSWREVTSLMLLSMSAAARVLLVAVRVATDAQSLEMAVAKLEMASTVSCQ